MTAECIFCKIANRLTNSVAHYHFEDNQIVAFDDLYPQAPVHILIISKKHIPTIADISGDDIQLLGKMIKTAQELAKSHRLDDRGYRLVFNVKNHGGQVVDHIHLHLIGGCPLGKMTNSCNETR